MRSRLSAINQLVREARVGRRIPADLHYGRADDPALATITDGLDKLFATLDLADFRGVPLAVSTRPVRAVVVARNTLCRNEDVVELTFAALDECPLPRWTPGCHVDVTMPSARVRQYSLCGDPRAAHRYTVAVRLIPDGHGGSAEMHSLRIGDEVSISVPRNGFTFTEHHRTVFVAGGIGITAILPMVRRARVLGLDWQLVYCGRDRDSMPYLDEIGTWSSGRVTVRTDVEHGLPDGPDLLERASPGCAVYVCGPPPMIESVRAAAGQTEATHFHSERFSPPPVVGGVPFEVRLARTGTTVTVASDQSALAAIQAERPNVPYSCRQGFCGACRVRVVTDTRPGDEAGSMLICVDRTDGEPVELDL